MHWKVFFECLTSCSLNNEVVDCTTTCYVRHLEPNIIDYPLNLFLSKVGSELLNCNDDISIFSGCIWSIAFIYSSRSHLEY